MYVKYALIAFAALVVAGAYLKGSMDGKHALEIQYAVDKAKWESQVSQLQEIHNKAVTGIINTYQQKTVELSKAVETAKRKQIIKYVGNTSCNVSNGFVDIHNKSAKGQPILSDPAPSSIQLSNKNMIDVAAIVSSNYYSCNEEIEKLKALQLIVKSYMEQQGKLK